MLEVHINIRWLIPLPRDESLEQQRDLLRGDLGDVQAVAHDGVGGRASALAEDIARFGKLDNVVDCQKVVFVRQLGNQIELLMDAGLDGLWHAVWPAQSGAGRDFLSQITVGSVM